MAMLIDTSVLGRLANASDAFYLAAKAAIAELHRRGETLHITAQNLIELRNFATRPANANGLGLSSVHAEAARWHALRYAEGRVKRRELGPLLHGQGKLI